MSPPLATPDSVQGTPEAARHLVRAIHSPPTTHHSPPTTHHSPPTTHHPPLYHWPHHQGGRRRLSAYTRLFNRAAGRDAASSIYYASNTFVDAAGELKGITSGLSSAAASLGKTSEDVLLDVDQVPK